MEWEEITIDICCDLIAGYAFKSKDFGEFDTKVIRIGDITPPFVHHDSAIGVNLANYDHRKIERYKIKYNDFVLAMTGATIGKVGRYISDVPSYVNQRVLLFKSKEGYDHSFIYYTINSYVFSQYVLNHIDSESAQPNISANTISKFSFKIPANISDQRKIAGILSALDSKIENNNKINANLEAQAEALFKSWFVDFTPFKDQPFVDSELGPIPQGWKVGKADDFYKINIGKTPPRKEKEWFSKNESDNKWISISDMGNCGLFISNSAEKLTNAAIKKFNISLVPVNTILLSFKLTIGRVAISDCDLTTNEAIARFILPDECYLEFSFLMLKLYNYSTLGSTSSIATAVNSKIIKSMKMVMPSLKVLEDFHTITNPLFEKIRFTQKENQRLAALRDTLLPKLMSGEIKL